jgi:hypothetical protein
MHTQQQLSSSAHIISWRESLPVEHFLGIASSVFVSKSCWGVQSAEEAYFRQSFTDFFASFKFNVYLGLFAQIINFYW